MVHGSLVVVAGSAEGTEIEVTGDLTFGRGESGVGKLGADRELSRHHARVRPLEAGGLLLEDLDSTNGTFVNGRRLSAPHVLASGDEIAIGTTRLRFEAGEATTPAAAVARDPGATVVPRPTDRPAPAERGAPLAPPAAEPPAAVGSVAGTEPPREPLPEPPPALRVSRPSAPSPPVEAPATRARSGGVRVPLWVLLVVAAVLIAGGVAAALLTKGSSNAGAKGAAPPPGRASSAPADCGARIGDDGSVADVVYVESNALGGHNSVIAIPYRRGDMRPLAMSQCSTGGSGSADLTDSGVLDADQQVIVNAAHTLLFAVNQGSDSIAVFHVAANGALSAVAGSPFPSGGMAPASVGLSGNTLVVANKAQDGVRNLSSVSPVYTTFTVGPDGTLSAAGGAGVTAQPGSTPTDAYVPPQGGVAFSTEETGPIRAFSISSSGAIAQAPGSPYQPPAAIYPPGYDPAKRFALGIAGHPHLPLLYIAMSTIPALAVYSYSPAGTLSFLNAALVAGAYLPCWLAITPDGHWLYTSNADTDNVTAFDISNPTHPMQIQTLPLQTPGNPWNEAIDPTGHFLFVNTPRDTLKVPLGAGNTQHVMQIGADGHLTELNATDPATIPVPDATNPQGIAIVPGPGA